MINKLLKLSSLAVLGVSAMFFSSCDEDAKTADLDLHVRFAPGGVTFEAGETYFVNATAVDNGTAVQFTTLRVYFSGFGLTDLAGNTEYSNAYVLAEPGSDHYFLGKVPSQAYSNFAFNIGIDSVTNHLDPTQYGSDNPLALQSPNMHWSWTSGYIFLRIDGIYDGDGDNIPDAANGFEVHLGTDNFLSNLNIPGTFGDAEAEEISIDLVYDPLVLFQGVNFPADNTTHTMDNMPMAMQVKDRIQDAITLDN